MIPAAFCALCGHVKAIQPFRFPAALQRNGFRLRFGEPAGIAGSLALLATQRPSSFGSAKNDAVLELAHGTGNLQVDLLEAGYRTVALDLSPAMGKIAQRKLWRKGLVTPMLRADVCQLPLKSASFAAIVCTFPTAFVFQAETLAELKRILKPDGSADFVLTGQLNGSNLVKALIRGLYRLTGQSSELLAEDGLHAFFGAYGFDAQIEVVDCQGSNAQVVMLSKKPQNL